MKQLFFAAALAVICLSCKQEPQITKSGIDPEAFKVERDGETIGLWTLTNSKGMEVCLSNYGARIVSIMVPDRNGNLKDVVLGYDSVEGFRRGGSEFGAVIGRYANRIGGAHFFIDGVEYQLEKNNNGNCLHGGNHSWQGRVFSLVEADKKHVKFMLEVPDGDSGFPGNLVTYVTYTLTKDNALDIKYEATTDKPTIVNMTNHVYFNLNGDHSGHSICDDELWVNATTFTPADENLIPTGEIRPVAGTPFDFTKPEKVGARIDDTDYDQIAFGGGYDHNFVLDTKGDIKTCAARLTCPESGIVMEMFTTEPGFQLYTGNWLSGRMEGLAGAAGKRHGICFETQHYPDSPNKPDWPSTIVRPGEPYCSNTIYAFSVEK